MRLKSSDLAPDAVFTDVNGAEHIVGRRNHQLGNRGQKTVVSFFREASCPFCNFRVYELDKVMPDLRAQNVRVINVFASTEDEIKRFLLQRPRKMIMVADPDMTQYGHYGIETATKAQKMKAILGRLVALASGNAMIASAKGPVAKDSKILPADFLISAEGKIVSTYYGEDIGDHIPIDQLMLFAN